jgi:5'-3' exonuclease
VSRRCASGRTTRISRSACAETGWCRSSGRECRSGTPRAKFGVEPTLIPDFLALVGDAQDGYPGIRGIGPTTAATLLNRHGPIESFPDTVLGDQRERALLFKTLATLRTDAPLFTDVNEIEWNGPTAAFAEWPQRMADQRIQARVDKARLKRMPPDETATDQAQLSL